jgi:hypothetical protein
MKFLFAILLVTAAAVASAAEVKFPGRASTDRAALEAAAKNGTPKTRVLSRLRLAQIATPEQVDTYEKQAKLIDELCAEEKLDDPSLKYIIPLVSADGKTQTWTVEGWHATREADDYREMWYLVNTGRSVRNVRAELGDAALFERYKVLLTRYFPKYSPGVVSTALLYMERLLPAVEPVRAIADLTHINSRVELVAEKEPERWKSVRKRMARMLKAVAK